MAEKIVLSKKWNKPYITAEIDKFGLQLGMDADDFTTAVLQEMEKDDDALETDLAGFVSAVVAEVGSVTWVFQDSTFRARLDAAIKKVGIAAWIFDSPVFKKSFDKAIDSVFEELKKASLKVM